MGDALIHAVLLAESGATKTLDWDGVRAWQPQDGLLWVHLDIHAEQTATFLESDGRVPPMVSVALVAAETRPRASATGDGLLLVLRGVNLNPGADPEDMVSIRLWVDADRVVSTRRRRLLSVQDVIDSHGRRPLTGTGDLVVRLADRLTERMNDIIDDLDERISELEQKALGNPTASLRAELAELRRDAIKLRRYLAPQREALGRLQSENVSWLTDADRLRLREVSDRLIRHLEDLDAVRERAVVVQEELMSQLSDQLNKRMYVLSIVAAMFLPLGFLTGLLGINVGGIPGSESPYGFMVFSLILIVVIAFQLLYFIRQRWF
jgi:zinc transporter